MKPERYAAPDVWRPSLLSGLRGLLNLLTRPRQALRTERKQWRQLRSHAALRRLGVLRYFESYPPDAIPPQYDDLWGLYQIVIARRPAVVLEIGGGYSTYVFAEAARVLAASGHEMVIHSVDQWPAWQQKQKDHLPPALARYVHFHPFDPVAIAAEWKSDPTTAWASRPVPSANLVYVDAAGGVEALLLEREAPDDFAILVDGRKKVVALLKQALKRRYRVRPGPSGTQTLFTVIPG